MREREKEGGGEEVDWILHSKVFSNFLTVVHQSILSTEVFLNEVFRAFCRDAID